MWLLPMFLRCIHFIEKAGYEGELITSLLLQSSLDSCILSISKD